MTGFLRPKSASVVEPDAEEEVGEVVAREQEKKFSRDPHRFYLGDDFSIPRDGITEPFGILAQRGAGKTYLSKVFTEEVLDQGLPVLVVDHLGVFHGLQSSADGEAPGYPIPIFGGDHANAPLAAKDGTRLADWAMNSGGYAPRSAVLDVSHLRKDDQRLFVADLAERLFQKNSRPLLLIVDEADVYIPQNVDKSTRRCLDAFEDVVRRGRVKGLGIVVITQRPAVINKNILSQISTLIVLRLGAPHDRDAIKDWIAFQSNPADARKVLSSLGGLPVGTAWFWSPGWLGILQKVAVRRLRTWDSSATPKIGEERRLPRVRADVEVT